VKENTRKFLLQYLDQDYQSIIHYSLWPNQPTFTHCSSGNG